MMERGEWKGEARPLSISRFPLFLFCVHCNHTLDHAASQHQADELIALAEAQRKDDMAIP